MKITIKTTDEGIQVDCSVNGKYVDMTDKHSVLCVAGELARISSLIVKLINEKKDNER